MDRNFKRALGFTLKFEGGYVNHPADPGGHTNKGITLATYRRYKPGATVADLKKIPMTMVERIYKDGYWDEVKAGSLEDGVDGATFDYGVNSGPATARKNLLKVVGGSAAETVKKLCARRLSIYQTFKHWKSFGKGWTRRIVAGEALWVSWALAASHEPATVKEAVQEEAVAADQKAKQQQTGAGTAGVGGSGGAVGADQGDISWWLIGGGIAVAVLVVAFLLWRAHINRQRALAYAEVAKEIGK